MGLDWMAGFLERLTPAALYRLRIVTRDEMLKMGFPVEHVDSDLGKREIDKMIDVLAPQTAEDLARRGMDSGLIERKVMR